MKIVVCDTYEEMSQKAAEMVKEQVNSKSDSVLGFATGSTPLGTYNKLIEMNRNKEIDFKNVVSFNLDEYYPIKRSDPQSYYYFMNNNLFNHINIDKNNTFIPYGEALDANAECEMYEEKIKQFNGIDLQILGIGRNGHIGFNEPETNLNSKTHKTALTDDTIDANSRFFDGAEVIKHALTMGMSTILSSKKIIILANGIQKHNAVSELLSDVITTKNPSTLLKVHPDVTLICDKEAYSDMHIGIDIGGMSVKIGVVDNVSIIEQSSIDVSREMSCDEIISLISKECKRYIAEYPISKIGVGTPGIFVDGRVTTINLPFVNLDLGKELEKDLNIQVYVQNDANCAALGEAMAGAAIDVKNTILLTLGTGIGCGIIIDNKIYSGNGIAGEVGHICIQHNGRKCGCGRNGCFERYASASALIDMIKEAVNENPNSVLANIAKESGTDAKAVFDAIDKNCETAKAVIDEYTSYLADGIISLINLFDPDSILISGGLSNAGDKLLIPLKEKLKTNIPVRVAALRNNAGIIGAACL